MHLLSCSAILAAVVVSVVGQNAIDLTSDSASITFGSSADVVLSRVGPQHLALQGNLHVTGDFRSAGGNLPPGLESNSLPQLNMASGFARVGIDPHAIFCRDYPDVALLAPGECDCRCAFDPDPSKLWVVRGSAGGVELLQYGYQGVGEFAVVQIPNREFVAVRIRTNGATTARFAVIFPNEFSTPKFDFQLEATSEWQYFQLYDLGNFEENIYSPYRVDLLVLPDNGLDLSVLDVSLYSLSGFSQGGLGG